MHNNTYFDNSNTSTTLSIYSFRIMGGHDINSNHYAYYRFSNDMTGSHVAMIVSPFFAHTDTQCELRFRFNLRADSRSGAGLLVTTEQLSLRRSFSNSKESTSNGNQAMDEEDEADWIRPILRERFEPDTSTDASLIWSHGRVLLGQFDFPTRIRIECHPSTIAMSDVGVLNVECKIDDLHLINCAEKEWRSTDDISACPKGRDSCRPFGADQQKRICLDDYQICDMHADCADGEDESDELYKCFQVPEGARCDFEDMLPAENGQTQRPGIPPRFYYNEGRLYKPGHFLFFSSYGHIHDGQHDILYSFALSPPLPIQRNPIDSTRQCMLRFFYCLTGFSPFQLFLQLRDKPKEVAKPIWAPPHDEHIREPCEWHRVSVHIKTESLLINGDYSLKLGFAKLAGSMGSIAIDDLSLSPDCFGVRYSLLPEVLSIIDEERHGNGSEWIVPYTGEYRLEMAGAPGGNFVGIAGDNHETRADSLAVNLRLNAGQQVKLFLGQEGRCICDKNIGENLMGDQKDLSEQLCSLSADYLNNISSGPLSFPGCSGGGASILFIGSKPVVVAAGGGGAFSLNSVKIDKIGQLPTILSVTNGLSISEHIGDELRFQQRSRFDKLIFLEQRHCPPGSRWNLPGGKGGGGASCNAGGGGGGGYQGGSGGLVGPGLPGTSAIIRTNDLIGDHLILPKSNPDRAFASIIACPQRDCPAGSNCTFGTITTLSEQRNGSISQPKCICPDGSVVEPNSATCLLVISLFLSLICCFKIIYRARGCGKKLSPSPSADVHELIAIVSGKDNRPVASNNDNCLYSDTNFGISGNPIYESLSLTPLKQIPRHSLKLDKIIGHGAFGEVFEGWLLMGEGDSSFIDDNSSKDNQYNEKITAIKVAIKSLPLESARDFGDDFETEARLLSQFKHQNIVTFFGVSFEQQPKLSFNEQGGDLKNFLRENRPRQQDYVSNSEVLDSTMLRTGDLLGFSLDIARGCQHLEETRFVHRDIAARNCLLTSKVGNRIVKIADFGMARDIYRNDYYRKGGKAFLPVRWMPPEAFLDGLFTSKTDVWAYGVLLWEIFSLGYIPYPGRDNLEVMRLVVAGDRLDPPVGIQDEIYELMLRCWNTESEQRPKFADLVCKFENLLKKNDLVAEPIPPMRNRLINERSVSGTPSMSSRAYDTQPTSTISRATASTGVYSSNSGAGACSSTSTYETMPIIGDGVCRAVYPPYQSCQSEEKFVRLYDQQRTEENCSDETGSQDESAGTVKLRNCLIKPSFLDSAKKSNAHGEKVDRRCFRWSRRPSLPDTTLPNEQREHSLPPYPSMRTTTRHCDDQDSGIESARSFEYMKCNDNADMLSEDISRSSSQMDSGSISARIRELEAEQQQLSESLLSLSTKFAQVQFRIQQIASAPAEQREGMLNQLKQFASTSCTNNRNLRLQQNSENSNSSLNIVDLEENVNVMTNGNAANMTHLVEELRLQLGECN
uniref:receptor protein-tyrosine kinase n=1 Tax=Meloidogyne javanica TaxID=6303 RepID=A0A915M3Z3_MELJA